MTVLCHISPLADHLTENFEVRHTFISIKQLEMVPKNISEASFERPKGVGQACEGVAEQRETFGHRTNELQISGLHSEWDGGGVATVGTMTLK